MSIDSPVVMERLNGVWPAAIVPFTESLEIDETALCAHIASLAALPSVSAIVVNGHAGEVTSLSAAERRRVIELAKQAAGEGAAVVAGVIGDSTRSAQEFAADAETAGADGLLLFPPPLFANGAQARPAVPLTYVTDVAASTRLPICLFQLAIASGLGYTTDVLVELCETVPNIKAVKEGSDNPVDYERNVRAIAALDKDVLVLTTNNPWLFESLVIGGGGILSGSGCVAADVQCDLYEAVARGDLAAARVANDRLFHLTEVFYRAPALDMHNRMKVALKHLGRIPHAAVRPPLLPPEDDEVREIVRAVEAAGLPKN